MALRCPRCERYIALGQEDPGPLVCLSCGFPFSAASPRDDLLVDLAIAGLTDATQLDARAPGRQAEAPLPRGGDVQPVAESGGTIRFDPRFAVAHNNREVAFASRGEYD